MDLLPKGAALGGSFEVRVASSGAPVICAKSEPKWKEDSALVTAAGGKGRYPRDHVLTNEIFYLAAVHIV